MPITRWTRSARASRPAGIGKSHQNRPRYLGGAAVDRWRTRRTSGRRRSELTDFLKAGHTAVVSDIVIAESYHALVYHYGPSKKDALAALFKMLVSRTVTATGQAAAVLLEEKLAAATPGFVDRLIHAGYLASGNQWATFAKGAAKLPKSVVLKAAP